MFHLAAQLLLRMCFSSSCAPIRKMVTSKPYGWPFMMWSHCKRCADCWFVIDCLSWCEVISSGSSKFSTWSQFPSLLQNFVASSLLYKDMKIASQFWKSNHLYSDHTFLWSREFWPSHTKHSCCRIRISLVGAGIESCIRKNGLACLSHQGGDFAIWQ